MAAREEPAERPSLIGIDRFEAPTWAASGSKTKGADTGAILRGFPAAMRVILGLAWRASRRLTLIVALAQLLAGAAAAAGLLATAGVLTALLGAGPTPDRVREALPAVAAVVFSYAVRGLLDSTATMLYGRLRPRIMQEAEDALNAAVAGVELSAFDDPSYRELIRQVGRRGIPAIEQSMRMLIDLIRSLVAVVSALVATALLSLWLLPVMLLAAAADFWSASQVGRLDFRYFLGNAARNLRAGVVQGLLTDREIAAELRAYRLQEPLMEEHRRVARRLTTEAVRFEFHKGLVQLAGRTLSGTGVGLAYVLLGFLLYAGSMPLALAGTAVVAMRTGNAALTVTVRSVNRIYELSHYVTLLRTLLRESGQRRRPAPVDEAPRDPGEIRLSGVSFTYLGGREPALDNVELSIRRGEVIALVGENGSGKTTLSKVICGLYRPSAGAVLWDGVDIASADEHSVLDQVALIGQQPARWPMTADHNIRIGRLEREDGSGEHGRAAAAAAGADEVIATLPDGERTLLSKDFVGGQDLSGGQWQRMGVARGIYRDAALLIADEPTAALDARAEAAVFTGLRRASGRSPGGRGARTTILVTHRLVNTRWADRIVVLSHGRIIEEGSHAALMAAGGTYAQMYALQAEAYTSA